MNNIGELKSALHHYIADIDDVNVLQKVKGYIGDLLDKESVEIVYESGGRPLTQQQYKKDIDEAISQAENGLLISQQDMEKDI